MINREGCWQSPRFKLMRLKPAKHSRVPNTWMGSERGLIIRARGKQSFFGALRGWRSLVGKRAMASQNPPSGTRSTPSEEDKGILERASETVREAKDQASDFAERAMEQGREATAIAQEAPAAIREAVHTSLKQQPMFTLAVAGALGFLLGALWKS
jgi:ElaB/YqjD/DUF883 family membrane-anchored ribosome-binding protein